MTQDEAEALLKQKIGLDANSIGSSMITRVIQQRMADCGITDLASYLGYVRQSSQEWEALVESVIVPETWFFRERESFNYLKRFIQSEWLPTQTKEVLRILSVPCSTGEEPYSIAIAILESGLTAANVHIDAVDISKRCLLAAQSAIYDQYSFRGSNFCFQERYFQRTATGFLLCEQVKQMVNFIQANLADPKFLLGTPPYDVIFCRNLLIYFDREVKERTIKILERLLKQNGLLFLGHAEAGLLLQTTFTCVRHPSAFAYRKTVNKTHNPTRQKKDITDKSRNTQVSKLQFTKKLNISFSNATEQIPKNLPEKISTHESENLLEIARKLANQGNLHEAINLCKQYLSKNRTSAEAYVLLGQTQQATGKDELAIESFQKAIYLEPTHEKALTHLALLREQQGDIEGASIIWQRIKRLQKNI